MSADGAVAGSPAPGRGALLADARAAVVPWILSRVLVLGVLDGARQLYDDLGRPPRPVALGQGLFVWDGAFYRAIAEDGYRETGRASLRFFPFVPMLARVSAGWPSVIPRRR